MKQIISACAMAIAAALALGMPAIADGSGDPKAAKDEDGKYYTPTARQPIKSRVTARRTGTPTPGFAVIIRTVMFATDPMAKGQLTLPGSRTH